MWSPRAGDGHAGVRTGGEPWVVMAVPGGRGLRVSFFQPGDALDAAGEDLGELSGNPREMGRGLRPSSRTWPMGPPPERSADHASSSSLRRTLPDAVRGSAVVKTISLGAAQGAMAAGDQLLQLPSRREVARRARPRPRPARPTRDPVASRRPPRPHRDGWPRPVRPRLARPSRPPVVIISAIRPVTLQRAGRREEPGVAGGEPRGRAVGTGHPARRPVAVAPHEHGGPQEDLAAVSRRRLRPPSSARSDCATSAISGTATTVEVRDGHLDLVERDPVVDDAGPRLGHAVGDDHVGGELTGRPAAAEEDAGEAGGVESPQGGRHQGDVRDLPGPAERLDALGVEGGEDA